MEKMIKTVWQNEKRFLTQFRHLLIYFILYQLVLHTNIYETGFVPNNFFTSLIIIGLILYRLFCFAVLPGIITYWLLLKVHQIVGKHH